MYPKSINTEKRRNRPARAVLFLFFGLFLLSNCQIKKYLNGLLLTNTALEYNFSQRNKPLNANRQPGNSAPCTVFTSDLLSDTDQNTGAQHPSVEPATLFFLSYLPLYLGLSGPEQDVHRPLGYVFNTSFEHTDQPIYIRNRYLLI